MTCDWPFLKSVICDFVFLICVICDETPLLTSLMTVVLRVFADALRLTLLAIL